MVGGVSAGGKAEGNHWRAHPIRFAKQASMSLHEGDSGTLRAVWKGGQEGGFRFLTVMVSEEVKRGQFRATERTGKDLKILAETECGSNKLYPSRTNTQVALLSL